SRKKHSEWKITKLQRERIQNSNTCIASKKNLNEKILWSYWSHHELHLYPEIHEQIRQSCLPARSWGGRMWVLGWRKAMATAQLIGRYIFQSAVDKNKEDYDNLMKTSDRASHILINIRTSKTCEKIQDGGIYNTKANKGKEMHLADHNYHLNKN
ncbi:hypothetical protein MJO29_001008, partial [Puccinia striiformis f. sp. tritici]